MSGGSRMPEEGGDREEGSISSTRRPPVVSLDEYALAQRQLPPLSPHRHSTSPSFIPRSSTTHDPLTRGGPPPSATRQAYRLTPPLGTDVTIPRFASSSSTSQPSTSAASYRALDRERHEQLYHAPAHAVPPLHTSLAVDYPTASSVPRIPRPPDRPLDDNTTAYLSRSAPPADFRSAPRHEHAPTRSRDSPFDSPRLKESRPGTYEQRQFSSASTASSSSRSLPSYGGMTQSRRDPFQELQKHGQSSTHHAFDDGRDLKRPRYESPPSDLNISSRPRLSPVPNHPTPTSISALLSSEHDSPQEPLSGLRSASTLPPMSLAPTSRRYPPSPGLRTSPYSATLPPPASVLLQSEGTAGAFRGTLDVRGEQESAKHPTYRPLPPTGGRVHSPSDPGPSLTGDRRRASQSAYPTHHRPHQRVPSQAEVWVTLSHSVRRNMSSWPEDRLEAYRTGYNDAMRSVQDGAVEIGGASYPHPGIVRRSSPDRSAPGPSYPSPTYTEPARSRRRSPDYPPRPGGLNRGPTYPPPPRYDRRGTREGYYQHAWAIDPPSPRHRGFYDTSPERERFVSTRGASYPSEISYNFAGPSRPHRQLISCYPCRTRKLKCDGQRPCSQCVRRDGAADCKYAEKVRRRGKGKRQVHSGSSQNSEEREEAPSEGDLKQEEAERGAGEVREEEILGVEQSPEDHQPPLDVALAEEGTQIEGQPPAEQAPPEKHLPPSSEPD